MTEETLVMQFSYEKFGKIKLRMKKPRKIMTQSKIVLVSFQATQVPPEVCNFHDQALHLNFVLILVTSVKKPAANYLSGVKSPNTGLVWK